MSFIELLEELQKIGVLMVLCNDHIQLHCTNDIPEHLVLCAKRYKQALIDREEALFSISEPPF